MTIDERDFKELEKRVAKLETHDAVSKAQYDSIIATLSGLKVDMKGGIERIESDFKETKAAQMKLFYWVLAIVGASIIGSFMQFIFKGGLNI